MDNEEPKEKDDSSDEDANEYNQFSTSNRFSGLVAGKKKPTTSPAEVPTLDFSRLQSAHHQAPDLGAGRGKSITRRGGHPTAATRPLAKFPGATRSGFATAVRPKPAKEEGGGFWASAATSSGKGHGDGDVCDSGIQGSLAAAAAEGMSSLNMNDSRNTGASRSFWSLFAASGGERSNQPGRFDGRARNRAAGASGQNDALGGGQSGAINQSDRRGQRCPFKVKEVCMTCFKNGAVVGRQASHGAYCATRNANHLWERNKGYVMFNDEGRAEVVRELKPSLTNLFAHKTPFIKICWRVERNGRCSFPDCGFAHNQLELRCWVWLLKNGKRMSDVAEELHTTVPVERKTAAPSAAAAAATSSGIRATASGRAPTYSQCMGTAMPRPIPQSGVAFMLPGIPKPNPQFLAHLEEELAEEIAFYCYVCDKALQDQSMLDGHFYTDAHRNRSLLVDARTWKFRRPYGPPPFRLCSKHIHGGRCAHSTAQHNRCPNAHSTEELDEWTERLEYLQRALSRREDEAKVEMLNKIREAQRAGKSILTPCSDYVDITSDGNTQGAVVDKSQPYQWKFILIVTSQISLSRVMLLDQDTAMYFRLLSPFASVNEEVERGDAFIDPGLDGLYEVIVEFKGINTPQTFTQKIIFDFNRIPFVYRDMVVHSGLDKTDLIKQNSLRYMLKSVEKRWTPENAEIIWISKARCDERMDIANIAANLNFDINESNYFSLLKQWLYAEQYKRQAILDELAFTKIPIVAVETVFDDNGKPIYPQRRDTLFAVINLPEPLSEDVDAITLLREDCTNAFVAPSETAAATGGKKRTVYEVDVVNRLSFKTQGVFSDRIHLQLSAVFVRHLAMIPGSKRTIDVQFNFFTKQFNQYARALDRLQSRNLGHLIFPDLQTYYPDYLSGKVMDNANAKIAAMPNMIKLWKQMHNPEQRNVMGHVLSCAFDRTNWIPPLVVFGPFGTGKTRTLAAAAATLLSNSAFSHTRILICTHAQTTADMYIKLLLEHTGFKVPQMQQILWRVFHSKAPPEVDEFIRYEFDRERNRHRPEKLTLEKLRGIRVVICTFSACDKLVKHLKRLGEDDYEDVEFTHIFIDEAAQALELETVLPLSLANRTTCIVVAGDHHQIRPPVYLHQAKELGRSYLERLYCYYDQQKMSMERSVSAAERAKYRIPSFLFNKNYRCHPEILSFLSAEFYGDPQCLVPCAEAYDHSGIKPLYFFNSEADEEVGRNGSMINPKEAQAVVKQVEYLYQHWPRAWGEISIGVAVPYVEQGNLITDMLFKTKVPMSNRKVDVSRVIQMQGKEYKALVISTVRGQKQLVEAGRGSRARNLAFLDDTRLINTAMTRAKYTVIVVGDSRVLCTLGACRDIWYHYVTTCGRKDTLLPESIKWPHLESSIGQFRAQFEEKVNTKNVADTKTADDLLVQQLTKKTHREMN